MPRGKFLKMEEVRALVNQGLIDKEIANRLGCCFSSVQKARKRFGLGCPFKEGFGRVIDRWDVLTLVRKGLTDMQVAKELQIHYNSVARIRNEGWPKLSGKWIE